MKENVKKKIEDEIRLDWKRMRLFIQWVIGAIVMGLLLGGVGTLFFYGMKTVTQMREQYPWMIVLLPLGGALIALLYKVFKSEDDKGTNMVLTAIHSENHIPLRMAPLIFISTLITHLVGGSSGREGAALQMGGSIGNAIGKVFRLNDADCKIMIMCGMSGAFSAVFGTPMAAAVFSMEVVTVGIMHYSALVPCVISSFVAHAVAEYFGVTGGHYVVKNIPELSLLPAVKMIALAMVCGLISIAFCHMLHLAGKLYTKFIKNMILRAAAGGVLVLLLTLLVGSQKYNGTGVSVIAACFETPAAVETFLLKMIFTALTLGAGFKGGEIVPTLFVGATAGSLFSGILGMDPSLCASVGMLSMFCGVTNCPISSLLIGFELFGYEGMPYYLLAVSFSYVLSGYTGLYSGQKIAYSKYRTSYINKHANKYNG